MSSLRPDLREVRIKHMVYGVPEGRTEVEIESKRENYLWRIYIEGDPEALQRVQKVVYKLHPSFSNRIIETDDWRNNFEYRIFGYGSFELEFFIYVKGISLPYSGTYYLDISRSNDIGIPVRIP